MKNQILTEMVLKIKPMDLINISFALTKVIDETTEAILNATEDEEKVAYMIDNQEMKETLKKIKSLQNEMLNKRREKSDKS